MSGIAGLSWPDPEGRQVRECARISAEYRAERAELARKWLSAAGHWLGSVGWAMASVGIMAFLSRRAAVAMSWSYLGWYGGLGLFGLWAFARGVLGWFHVHNGYVAMSGHVWACNVCGRPPRDCAEVPECEGRPATPGLDGW